MLHDGRGRRIAIDIVIGDGADLMQLVFVAFACFGSVVLLATLDTRSSVGRALNCSSFWVGSFVGWPSYCSHVVGFDPGFLLSFWCGGSGASAMVTWPSFPVSWVTSSRTSGPIDP